MVFLNSITNYVAIQASDCLVNECKVPSAPVLYFYLAHYDNCDRLWENLPVLHKDNYFENLIK